MYLPTMYDNSSRHAYINAVSLRHYTDRIGARGQLRRPGGEDAQVRACMCLCFFGALITYVAGRSLAWVGKLKRQYTQLCQGTLGRSLLTSTYYIITYLGMYTLDDTYLRNTSSIQPNLPRLYLTSMVSYIYSK